MEKERISQPEWLPSVAVDPTAETQPGWQQTVNNHGGLVQPRQETHFVGAYTEGQPDSEATSEQRSFTAIDTLISLHESTDNPLLKENLGKYLESNAAELAKRGDSKTEKYIAGFITGTQQAIETGKPFIAPAWIKIDAPDPKSRSEVTEFSRKFKQVNAALEVLGYADHDKEGSYQSEVFLSIAIAQYESSDGSKMLFTAAQQDRELVAV